MQEDQLILFVTSRPFEPFVIQLVGGREISIRHPELIATSRGGLGLWITYDTGHVEAIDTSLIASLKTVNPVNFSQFMG